MLGGLRLSRGAWEVTQFPTYKTGALLAYLALVAGGPHPREALVDLFWPEATPEAGRNSLSAALSALRRLLQTPGLPPLFDAGRTHVGLRPGAVVTDVAAFEAAARARGGEVDTRQRLERAARLYAGDLLPGCYEDWAGAERERLRDIYLDVLDRLTHLLTAERDWDAAIACTHQALRADPLREQSHRTLMRLYAATGRAAAALDHFRGLEQRLKREMDGPPEPETRALAAEIAGVVPGPSAPALPMVPAWPAARTRFFGRAAERDRLLAQLRPGVDGIPPERLVTLTGPGGIGKTRLALEAAGGLRGAYHERVWFVPLADLPDSTQLPPAIATIMGLDAMPGGSSDPWEPIAAALGRAPALLVLDNFEPLIAHGAALLAMLLARTPALACLITSREPLGLAGEQELLVDPLPTPATTAPPEAVASADSVALFADRARAADPAFAVITENAREVAALCAALEGIPLALELAAAWARVLTPAQMLARLDRRFDLLVSRRRDLPERHRTLWAAVDSSVRFLPDDLQKFFARLSVFRGGWTLDAAAAVGGEDAGATLERLRRLQEKSLLTARESGGAMRYRMLETLREYADARLAPEEARSAGRRHFDVYKALTARGMDQARWLETLGADLDNLRAAFTWGLAEAPAAVLGPAARLAPFWTYRGLAAEGRAVLKAALEATPGADAADRARALTAMGEMAAILGDSVAAHAALTHAREDCRDRGDTAGEAAALAGLGDLAMNRGDYDTARDRHEAALALARTAGDGRAEARSLASLGYVAREQGDWDTARRRLERAVAVSERIGDRVEAVSSRGSLAHAALGQGDRAYARQVLEDVLAAYREFGSRPGQSWTLASLASLDHEDGDFLTARARLEEALALNREIGHRAGEAWNLDSLGSVLGGLGDPGAIAAGEQALALHRELGDRAGEARSLRRLADAAAARGARVLARRLYAEALSLMEEIGLGVELPATLEAAARFCAAGGEMERAARLLGAAVAARNALGLSDARPPERDDALTAQVEASLGHETYADAFHAGRTNAAPLARLLDLA